MKLAEIIKILQEKYSPELASSFDIGKIGLQFGTANAEVNKIMVALDGTSAVVDEAIENHVDLLLTHHPFMFNPMLSLNYDSPFGVKMLKVFKNKLNIYAMHTNFDSAPGCMADIVADRLNFTDQKPLEAMGEISGTAYGIGKTGSLKVPMKGLELAREVKNRFELPFVTVYGSELYEDTPVVKAATCPGAGGSELKEALKAGAQAFITGDISHHEGIDAAAQGMMIIDAGHYGLEHIFMDFMEGFLKEKLPADIEVVKMAVKFPAVVL